jgi:bifunctional enzyme CysN/CysC
MVTGASTADAAVILIDARKGVLTQTRRHSYLAALLGIRHVALAVNKMDLVGYDWRRFAEIEDEYRDFAAKIGVPAVKTIPVSALRGDNVVARSEHTPWYDGPTLIEYLESVEIDQDRLLQAPFRMPVQLVIRPDLDFRGFAGTVAGGVVRPGDPVKVLPSGRETRVARIVTYDGDLEQAEPGQSVTLTLADEVDVSRGDVIGDPAAPPAVADKFDATIAWMSDRPLLRGRNYLMRIGSKLVTATISPVKYKVNVNSLERVAANQLELNEIGVCELELDQPVAFDTYAENRDTGGFILIDRITNDTVGAGMLRHALRRSENLAWQALEVDKAARAELKDQAPFVLWLTGLPAAGKTALANVLEKELHRLGRHTYLLDGENIRQGLSKDLGFTDADRVENIRRVAEVARLMVEAGLVVIVAFISPFRNERRMARALVEPDEFVEVFVDAPVDVAAARDPKGLYAKAQRGELRNFTGIDSPYEPPEEPDVHVDTGTLSPEESAERVLAVLRERGLLAPAAVG